MKITVSFSQVEGPAVAALTQNLADILAAISLQGTDVELSLQCATEEEEEELPTEMVQPLDYAAAQGAVVEAVLPDSKPSNWDKLMQIYFAQSKYDRENPKPRRTPERI